MRGADVHTRFWRMVEKGPGCWEWTGARVEGGYGIFQAGGRARRAHRFLFTLQGNPVPAWLQVCHRCDNPSCVRPDHLFWGTAKENVRDCVIKGRRRPPLGAAHGMARLSDGDVIAIRRRRCAGEGGSDLGREYGVCPATISLIVNRKHWRHLP